VVCLSFENLVDIVQNIHSMYFLKVADIVSKAPYVKATYIVLSAVNDGMLSNISKNDFFLDKVHTNFFLLHSSRWFDNNRFTSLTLPVISPLNFSLSTLSLVGNDISTVQYALEGPLSETEITGLNQVLW
jgi:hypothetical protein